MLLDLILRLLHILSAIVLVGGTFYQRIALVPALGSIAQDAKSTLEEACRGRWSKAVMATSGLLLFSGLINAVRMILRYEIEGGYHILVVVKLLVAMAIFGIASILAGKTSTAIRFREKASFWLSVNLVLAVLIVCVAGYMKLQPRTEKVETPAVMLGSGIAHPNS